MMNEVLLVIVDNWILILMFAVVAIIYSSVGFGGGSSYLAILSMWGLGVGDMKVIALLCNIAVVMGSVYLYYKQGFYKDSNVLALVILSVPMAFLGAYIDLEGELFYIVLGLILVGASILMLRSPQKREPVIHQNNVVKSTSIGGVIGFVSGLLGIGGGMFLSPYLHIVRYDSAIKIAAYCSMFILVNSISALFGNITHGSADLNTQLILALVIAVFVGGQIGTRLAVKNLSPIWIRRITAVVVMFVGVRVLWMYLF